MSGVWWKTQHNNIMDTSKMYHVRLVVCTMTIKEQRSGCPGTACLIKCSFNHPSNNSVLIQPLSLRPYLAPGTSFFVHAWLRFLASKMIMGGIAWPIALTQPATVTSPFFPACQYCTFLVLIAAITFGVLKSNGIPDSPTLYI